MLIVVCHRQGTKGRLFGEDSPGARPCCNGYYINCIWTVLFDSKPVLDIFLSKVVPHITDAIQEWIERAATIPVDGEEGPADVCIIELGGTIGDNDF